MTAISSLKKLIVFKDEPLRQAIQKLNDAGEQVLLVVENNKRLCGILTDGDLRRHILHGGSLDVSVLHIMNKNFMSLKHDEKQKALDILKYKKINHIPIVDKDGVIVDLITSLDFIKKKTQNNKHPVVIMAGGRGIRLNPITKIIPKPLIPVGGKTMIEIIIDNFNMNGFNQYYIILNYKKEMVRSYFLENKINQKIEFFDENNYMGTVGGLSLLKDKIDKTFILSNCDILAKFDYSSMLNWHQDHKADFTILGLRREFNIPYGVIEANKDNYVFSLNEKPNFNFTVSTGIYIMEPSLFKLIPNNKPYEMDEFVNAIVKGGKKVTCYPIEDGLFDIGQFEEYKHMLKVFGP